MIQSSVKHLLIWSLVTVAASLLPIVDGKSLGSKPPQLGCAFNARKYSKMNLMGGWRQVDEATPSDLRMYILAKALVIQKLKELGSSRSRDHLPGEKMRNHPAPFRSLNVESSKVKPIEAYTQVVAGINRCIVYNISQCANKLCDEPVGQCAVLIYEAPWLVRDEPSASDRVKCLPIPGSLTKVVPPPRDRQDNQKIRQPHDQNSIYKDDIANRNVPIMKFLN